MRCSRKSTSVASGPDRSMGSMRGNASGTSYRRYERHPVSCEIDGDVFTGHYWVAGMILVVSTIMGRASRQLANRQPEELARSLLRDFVLASERVCLLLPRDREKNHCERSQPINIETHLKNAVLFNELGG